MRILIVDDNDVAGRSVVWRLRAQGFESASVNLGRQVPGVIREFRPDVLVLDVSLPDVNGALIARLIRQDWPDLPIILAAGADPSGLELPSRTESLSRPYSIEALRETIQRMSYRSVSSDL